MQYREQKKRQRLSLSEILSLQSFPALEGLLCFCSASFVHPLLPAAIYVFLSWLFQLTLLGPCFPHYKLTNKTTVFHDVSAFVQSRLLSLLVCVQPCSTSFFPVSPTQFLIIVSILGGGVMEVVMATL